MEKKKNIPFEECISTVRNDDNTEWTTICPNHKKPTKSTIKNKINREYHTDFDKIKWKQSDHWWCALCGKTQSATQLMQQMRHFFTANCSGKESELFKKWALSVFILFYSFLFFFILF